MKVCEILTLNEANQKTFDDQAFIHIEHNLNTFGDFMKKFPYLDNLVKEIALEHQWDGDAFAKLKQLQIPEKYLYGQVSKTDATAEFVGSKAPVILASFTSVDEEVGFQADSIFHEPIIICMIDGTVDKQIYYVLEVNDTRTSYAMRRLPTVLQLIRNSYPNVNFKDYAKDVKVHGAEYVLDNLTHYSMINMLTVFSNEV